MDKEHIKIRIEELSIEQRALKIKLDEVTYCIQGYKNALINTETEKKEEVENEV